MRRKNEAVKPQRTSIPHSTATAMRRLCSELQRNSTSRAPSRDTPRSRSSNRSSSRNISRNTAAAVTVHVSKPHRGARIQRSSNSVRDPSDLHRPRHHRRSHRRISSSSARHSRLPFHRSHARQSPVNNKTCANHSSSNLQRERHHATTIDITTKRPFKRTKMRNRALLATARKSRPILIASLKWPNNCHTVAAPTHLPTRDAIIESQPADRTLPIDANSPPPTTGITKPNCSRSKSSALPNRNLSQASLRGTSLQNTIKRRPSPTIQHLRHNEAPIERSASRCAKLIRAHTLENYV